VGYVWLIMDSLVNPLYKGRKFRHSRMSPNHEDFLMNQIRFLVALTKRAGGEISFEKIHILSII